MRSRRGVVLLEALVALTVVALVFPSLMTEVRALELVRRKVALHNQRLREADRLLQSVSLWSTAELDRHLGARPQGAWVLDVRRDVAGWYAIAVREGSPRGRIWFATVVSGARL